MKKFISSKYFLYIIGTIIFFAIWEIVSLIVHEPIMVFPNPIRTFKNAFELLGTEYLYKCLGYTLLRTIIGFLIAFLIALILGTFAGNYPKLQSIFKPTITALKAIPTAAMVFLFLVLVQAKNTPVLIVTLISFPILYEAVLGGISNIDNSVTSALKVDAGENKLESIFKVKLPMAMPYILVGIASSFALSFKIEIMAEIIAGSTKPGLGSAIKASITNDPSNMVPIFAYSLIAIIFILLVDLLATILRRKTK